MRREEAVVCRQNKQPSAIINFMNMPCMSYVSRGKSECSLVGSGWFTHLVGKVCYISNLHPNCLCLYASTWFSCLSLSHQSPSHTNSPMEFNSFKYQNTKGTRIMHSCNIVNSHKHLKFFVFTTPTSKKLENGEWKWSYKRRKKKWI
jgi:hypothetical protein